MSRRRKKTDWRPDPYVSSPCLRNPSIDDHIKLKEYRKCKLPSTSSEEITVDVYKIGKYAMLQTLSRLGHKPTIFVKAVDANIYKLKPDMYYYDIKYLAQLQPIIIDIKKADKNLSTIKELRSKKHLTYFEQKILDTAYNYNNTIDIYHTACRYLRFLHIFNGKITNSNTLVLINNACNVKQTSWDNDYMVCGTCDCDIGMVLGYGTVRTVVNLKNGGQSEILRKSLADVFNTSFKLFIGHKSTSTNYYFRILSAHIGWVRTISLFWKCIHLLNDDSEYSDFYNALLSVTSDHTAVNLLKKLSAYMDYEY